MLAPISAAERVELRSQNELINVLTHFDYLQQLVDFLPLKQEYNVLQKRGIRMLNSLITEGKEGEKQINKTA